MLKKPLLFILIAAVGFIPGSLLGFYNGLGALGLIDSAPKGLIAVKSLNELNEGSSEWTQVHLEYEVDRSLVFYSMLKDSWWFPAYQSGLMLVNPEVHEKHIRRVATYRQSHPSPTNESTFDQVPKGKELEYKELAKGIKEHHRRLKSMVELYAQQNLTHHSSKTLNGAP